MRASVLALCSVFAALMPRDGNACTMLAEPPGFPGPGSIRITASVLGYRDVDRPAQDVARAPGVRLRYHTALNGRTEETVVLLRLAADCSSLPTPHGELADRYPVGATVGLSIDARPGLALVSPLVFHPGGTGALTAIPTDLPRTVDGDLDFSRVDARQFYLVATFEFDRGVLALRAAHPPQRVRRLTNLVRLLAARGDRWRLDRLLSETALSTSEIDRVIEEFDRALASAPSGRGR